jgi:hypothetical protein
VGVGAPVGLGVGDGFDDGAVAVGVLPSPPLPPQPASGRASVNATAYPVSLVFMTQSLVLPRLPKD